MSPKPARIIPFYLPQFHRIPENDEWWGNGFTEWTNVAKAKPLFPGHYQPRLPADLGYYDLRVPETRHAQAEMARRYGIEGFCYWHYWFAGDRLLETPFNEVLKTGEPSLPFCLAWANESWTGIWYGAPGKMLKRQTYPGMDDHKKHFETLLEAFSDSRYITVDGKPLFLIYKPKKLPNSRAVLDYWRELAIQSGLKGVFVVGVTEQTEYVGWDAQGSGFDAITVCNHSAILGASATNRLEQVRRKLFNNERFMKLWRRSRKVPWRVFEYEDALKYFIVDDDIGCEYFPSVVPDWDNTPRCGANGLVLRNSSPKLFQAQLSRAFTKLTGRSRDHSIVFVKSWNEWAEGNYLEPDQKFGTAYLQAVFDALKEQEKTLVPSSDSSDRTARAR